MDMDMQWEYNAPQFVDFTAPLKDDHDVEEYFNFDHENGIPVDSSGYLTTGSTPASATPKRNTPNRKSCSKTPILSMNALKDSNCSPPRRSSRLSTPKGDGRSNEHVAAEKENITNGQSDSTKKSASRVPVDNGDNKKDVKTQNNFRVPSVKRPSRLNTSLQKSPVKKTLKRSASATLLRSNSAKAVQQSSTAAATRKSIERNARTTEGGKSVQRSQSFQSRQRTSSISKTRMTPSEERRDSASRQGRRRSLSAPMSRSLSIETAPKSKAAKDNAPMRKFKPSLLRPTATINREATQSTDHRSAEEREQEEIKRLRKELADRKKKAEESYKMVQSSSGYMPVRSVLALTRAEGFQFATDSRIKSHAMETRKDRDFQSGLRHHSPAPSGCKPLKRTIPAPFHLHEEKKRKNNDGVATSVRKNNDGMATSVNFKSVAEQLQAFSRKTPERFRTKPVHRASSPGRSKPADLKLTIPKTPNFETRTRSRPTAAISQVEKDEQEIEEIQKYKFKAKPVNENILKNPAPLQKVSAKELTQFDDFDLETDRRIKERRDRRDNGEEHYEFHAKPVPKHILEGQVGVKPKETKALTVPESPAFALKNRIRQMRQSDEVNQSTSSVVTRSRPAPHIGLPFQPSLDHRMTVARPFSFDARNKQRLRDKEEKIQKVYDEEKRMREFQASRLPTDSPDLLPAKKAKQPTVPEPFDFEIDHRGAHRAEEWEHRLKEELKEQRQQTTFKAKPAMTLYKQPFMPRKSTKNLTDYANQEFELSTATRRERWAELERYKHEKEVELDIQQREMERRRQEEEEEEVKRLRHQAVHKAQGVRHYKSVEIKRSELPLTEPTTPRFSERLKSRFQKH